MTNNRIEIDSESDVVTARQAGRRMASDLGLGLSDQTRLATAISELVRNVVQYAGKGVCIITDESDQKTIKVRVDVEDSGPGISDIEKAMESGYSTNAGLGAGLPGTKRLVDDFHIESEPGHTRVTIVMIRRKL